jgi:eukaryotic-like serine/threonine-protein kinase
VMVGAYGEVVLMDWGIAKRLRGEGPAPAPPAEARTGAETSEKSSSRGALFQTRSGELIGTPAYMSPEQSRGESIDKPSDVYALSVLFYELLTLRHPLAEKTTLPAMLHAISHETAPLAGMSSHPHQPSISMDLSWFVRKGLEKKPADRYASVAEMITRLERRAEGVIPVQCPITFMKRTTNGLGRFIDRHPFLATLAMLASVVVVIAGALRSVR